MNAYELLAKLIAASDLTPTEKQDAQGVIEHLKTIGAFGVAGEIQIRRHQCSVILETGRCSFCDEPMQQPQPRGSRRW